MKTTGVFYHEICGQYAYKTLAMGVEEGYKGLEKEGLLSHSRVKYFESAPLKEEELNKVHTLSWINQVKSTPWWEVSLYSMGGAVQATEEVLKENVHNALVIGGVGGHHAHEDTAWGGCYFNDSILGVHHARENHNIRKIAIVDTDTHHGDGTRSLSAGDEDILHLCFCGIFSGVTLFNDTAVDHYKFCFDHGYSDEEEIAQVKKEIPGRLKEFQPELIYWFMGLDTHKASYGTATLSEDCYPQLAKIIKNTAEEVCDGKLVVKTACNAPGWVTEYVMPRILEILLS